MKVRNAASSVVGYYRKAASTKPPSGGVPYAVIAGPASLLGQNRAIGNTRKAASRVIASATGSGITGNANLKDKVDEENSIVTQPEVNQPLSLIKTLIHSLDNPREIEISDQEINKYLGQSGWKLLSSQMVIEEGSYRIRMTILIYQSTNPLKDAVHYVWEHVGGVVQTGEEGLPPQEATFRELYLGEWIPPDLDKPMTLDGSNK